MEEFLCFRDELPYDLSRGLDPAWHTLLSEVRGFLGKKELVSTVNEKLRKKTGLGISGWIKGPET